MTPRPLLGIFGENARFTESAFREAFSTSHEVVYFKSQEALLQRRDDLVILVSKMWPSSFGTPGKMQMIQGSGAGTELIERSVLPPGCLIGHSPGHEIPIAEYVAFAMLHLSLSARRMEDGFRTGSKFGGAFGGLAGLHPELCGKTVCFLGYGGIARESSARAACFGMVVGVVSRSPKIAPGISWALSWDDLRDALGRSDFVVVTCPLTPETEGRIGAAELRAMKPDAFLINVARAKVVNEDALYEALASRQIAGAALDVWYRDPSPQEEVWNPANRDFLSLPNVLVTPHASGWSDNLWARRSQNAVANVRDFLAGKRPPHLAPS